MDKVIETKYPLTFREETATILGEHVQHQQSVELVGMKRVGINNFLRFFLFHPEIQRKCMPKDESHLFILVDLNNLIEREIFPFWRLTFKRIVDASEKAQIREDIKTKISNLFLASIQTGDTFLTYDGVREALLLLVQEHIYPTLFLTRFDRLKDAVTVEFFNNLQALRDGTNGKLSYVFTSYRELDVLVHTSFERKDRSLFSDIMYITPISPQDSKIILISYMEKYSLKLQEKTIQAIIYAAGGHVQYLQLALIILQELHKRGMHPEGKDLLETILVDERVTLQSEELWESLSLSEQKTLLRVLLGKRIQAEEKEKAKYLWNTGCLVEKKGKSHIFSPLFASYLKQQEKRAKSSMGVEFSKKEYMLFTLLHTHMDVICEREVLVEYVWPECKEYGVSDWSVDRLVARVRNKLKKQKGNYEIITIRTRGYKLTAK